LCELDVAPTAIAPAASAGESMVASVGADEPFAPSLPAAAITSMPAFTAFCTATASGSQGVFALTPQFEPESCVLNRAGAPSDSTAISI
jgi:hypothetical protein